MFRFLTYQEKDKGKLGCPTLPSLRAVVSLGHPAWRNHRSQDIRCQKTMLKQLASIHSMRLKTSLEYRSKIFFLEKNNLVPNNKPWSQKDQKGCSMYISSLHYNTERWRKVAVCIYHHFIITRKDKEKLHYVHIITTLQQGRIKKSCRMYISSLHYNTKGQGKVAVCIYHHVIRTRKDKEKLRYVYIITSL